jgi:hypothetical protein
MGDSAGRRTLDTARFYLSLTDAAGLADRVVFQRHLETAIVWARSVTFHIQKEYADASGFKSWWSQQQDTLSQDRRAKFFSESRTFVVHKGPLPVRQDTAITVGTGVLVTTEVRVRVVHSTPWYRRSPRDVWRRVHRAFLRLLPEWRHRRAETRRMREFREWEATRGGTITSDLYFSDPEWSATPALTLLNQHLDTLDAVVAATDSRFGQPPTGTEGG